MAIFSKDIFDPNVFLTDPEPAGTDNSVVEKKKGRSRGRSKGFLWRGSKKVRKVFLGYESYGRMDVRAFKPVSTQESLKVESIRLDDLDIESLLEEAREQVISAASKAADIKTVKKTLDVVSLRPKRPRLQADSHSLITMARELVESAKDLIGIKDDPQPQQNDCFLDILVDEMVDESFRQDVIDVSIKGSVEDAVSSAWLGNFKDLNQEQSQYLRAILQDAFVKNASHSATIARIQRYVGVSYEQAKTIVDTEFQQIRNRARVLAYRDTEDKDSRYVWDHKRDRRVCELCESIKRLSLPGVPLKRLEEIIIETQQAFGADTTRRYIAHVRDRCRISRVR